MESIFPLIILCGGMLLVLALVSFWSNQTQLNIKSRTVGDGQHGTARWATFKEIKNAYRHIPYNPKQWRKGKGRPPVEAQGLVVGSTRRRKGTTVMVVTGDVPCLMIAAAAPGKTACFRHPNLEYACATCL